jgi:hypothetical protein
MPTFHRTWLIGLALFAISGCVSVADINQGFRRLDRMWLVDYQKTEDDFRYRVVDAEYSIVFQCTKRAFNDLGVAVQKLSLEEGIVSGACDAPTPLTMEEWGRVVAAEQERVKEVGGWMFNMSAGAKGYVVHAVATIKPAGNKTFVLLDYKLDMPKYKSMGFQPSEYAPPLAVQLATTKFWAKLGELLEGEGMPLPRLRTEKEKEKLDQAPEIASSDKPQKEARLKDDQASRLPSWRKLDDRLIGTPSKTALESDKLFRKLSKTVWMVWSEKAGSHRDTASGSLGSAVAISRKLLLTNCHVVKDSQTIRLIQGDSTITAKVLSADEETDRCVLTAETDLIDFVRGGRAFNDLQVGEKVYTIGSPGGFERTLGDGIISGLRTTKSVWLIQTTAPISPGSSGGGLFDQAGNLIGVTTFLFKGGQNLNFAIAVSDYFGD